MLTGEVGGRRKQVSVALPWLLYLPSIECFRTAGFRGGRHPQRPATASRAHENSNRRLIVLGALLLLFWRQHEVLPLQICPPFLSRPLPARENGVDRSFVEGGSRWWCLPGEGRPVSLSDASLASSPTPYKPRFDPLQSPRGESAGRHGTPTVM